MYDAPTRRVSAAALDAFGVAILRSFGLSAEHAAIVEANLLEADMRGVQTHGHHLLPLYEQRFDDGEVNQRPNVRLVSETRATVVFDGDYGPGQVAAHATMQAVIEKARGLGTAIGLTRNSTHLGAAAHFAIMALEHDMIGYAATNTRSVLFPFGGRSRVPGNNPIAYAVPAADERPLVLDMAMAMVANQRIMILSGLGHPIPPGLLLDSQGRPTTDLQAHLDGGAAVPIGGPKGSGLAQVVDAVAGVLSGGAFGTEVGARTDAGWPGGVGHVFQVLDVAAFMPVDEFKARMDRQIRQMHEAERAEGTERIYVAGEMEWERMDDARANGVPLLEGTLDELNTLAERRGVSLRV